MRLRQLVLACGFSTFALSQFASALGLGEVTLKSALNQPLEAEIKLLDTGDLSAEQILINLASPADFERNGIDRIYFYSELQFQVELTGAGAPKVIVTSRNPVREPYLNFLVEARWTAGRLLREYTLLMDLPTFGEDSASAAVSAPAGQSSATRQATSPSRSSQTYTPPSSRSGSAPSRSATITGEQYQIRANDTLWEIAEGVRGSSGASVHQAMMALYEANPDAFINGNINLLRRGQILRIPDAQEMTATSRSAAVRQFAQQIQDSSLGAQLNASRRTEASRSASSGVSGSVKLTAPSATSSGSAGQGSGSNQGSGSGLESELAVTLEELDKSKSENAELSSRVKDLEAQIATMEQLVAVSNEKMRSLQVAAEQQNAELSAAPSSSLELSSADISSEDSMAAEPVAAVASSEAVSSASSAVSSKAAVAPKSAPAKTVVAPPPAPSAVDVAVENAPWIGLGVLVLGLGGYFFYRRRQEAVQAEAEESFDQDTFAMDSELQPEEYQEEFNESLDLDDAPDEVADEAPVEAETGDAVAEAEIYIAYGQLDKAEDLLQNALKKDPDASEIRLKLLEVYSHKQDLGGFDKEYALLASVAGGAILARAAELRSAIPGAGEAEAPVAGDSSADVVADEDFNFADLDLSDEPESVVETGSPSMDLAGDDLDFDLDLGDDLMDSPETSLADESFTLDEEELALDSGDTAVLAETDLDDLDFSVDQELGDLGDLDLSLGEESLEEADDFSELSLALDDLEKPNLPEEVAAEAGSLEDEFSFDLESEPEDLSLEADLADAPEGEDLESVALDVAADDFNLDMNVDEVDLAALDHEMEALDLEIEPQADLDVGASTLHETPLELEDEGELGGLSAELDSDEFAELALTDDVPDSGLSLTDDLDQLPSFEAPEEDNELLADLDLDAAETEAFAEDKLEALDEDLLALGEEADEALPAMAEDDVFSAALSEFGEEESLSLEQEGDDGLAMSEADMESDLDFLADADEAATKLDLARAYIDMGDAEGARDILSEVIHEGNEQQRGEAEELLSRIQA